jgi:hypothetical protein
MIVIRLQWLPVTKSVAHPYGQISDDVQKSGGDSEKTSAANQYYLRLIGRAEGSLIAGLAK